MITTNALLLRTRAAGDEDGWKTGTGREKEGRGGPGRGAQGRARRTMPPIAFVAAGVPRRGGEGQGEFGGPIVCVFVFYKKDQLTVFGVIVGGGATNARRPSAFRWVAGWEG